MSSKLEIARRALRQAERQWAVHGNQPETAGLTLDIPPLDRCFPQGLACPALHEVHGVAGDGAATGFVRHLAERAGTRFQKPVFWLSCPVVLDSGGYYAPALQSGFDHGLYFIDSPHPRDSFWALEEILRSGQTAAVVAEVPLPDLLASRRLQLAAEDGNSMAFLLCPETRHDNLLPTAARSRWHITGNKTGWQVSLLRGQGMRPGHWSIKRNDTEVPLHLAAPVSDRSLYPQASAA